MISRDTLLFLNSYEMRSSAIFIFEDSFDVWSIFFSLRLYSIVNGNDATVLERFYSIDVNIIF